MRKTLLIVDDEEAPRQSLQQVFKKEYDILLAQDGPAALEIIARHPVDAAVVDIRMPGMSGIDVLTIIKEMHPHVEVVMLTGYETFETARQALRLGACDYLTKPADLQTMRAAVAHAMECRTFSERMRDNHEKMLQLQSDLVNHRLREEFSRTKAEIYAGVIHDLNNPLTSIYFLVEMAYDAVNRAERLEGSDLEAVKDELAQIGRHVHSCMDITSRYQRLLRGSQTDKSEVHLIALLKDLRELLKVHELSRKNRLIIHDPHQDERLAISGTDLIQVLMNLTINAFQSTPKPVTVEMRFERQAQPLDLARCVEGSQDRFVNLEEFGNTPPFMALYIQDDGPGVTPEVIPQLFQLYFTTKPAHQGTGLGLIVVQRLLKLAGCALHFHSEPGHGSTVTLYLPIRGT